MINFQKFRLPYRDDALFGILMLTVFAVPISFNFYAYEKFEILKITLLLILTGAAAIVLAIRLFKGQMLLPPLSKAALLSVVGLVVWIVVSSAYGITVLNSFFGAYPRFVNSAVFYILMFVFFLLLLINVSREKLIFLLKILLLDALLVSVVGIIQSMGVAFYNGLDVSGFLRPPSLLGNPDTSSMFVVVLLPLAIYFLAMAQKFWQKIYYFFVIFCILASAIIFASRGAWLGGIVALVLSCIGYLIYKAPKKFIVISALALFLGVGLGYVSLQDISPASLRQTFDLTESNVNLRFFAWDVASKAMLEHPWLGIGPGNFQNFFQSHRDQNLSDLRGQFDDAHNLFLQLGASLGIPFLLAILAILAMATVAGAKASWHTQDFLPLALVISLVTFCLIASFAPIASACFMLLAVLLAGLFSGKNSDQAITKLSLIGFVAGLMGTVLIILGLIFITSETLFFKGYSAYLGGDYGSCSKLCTLAKRINPYNQFFASYTAASEAVAGVDPSVVSSHINEFTNLYPQDSTSFVTASNVYFLIYERTGNLDYIKKSIDMMQQAIKLDPNNGSHYSYVAYYYFANNELANAMAYASYGLRLQYNKDIPSWMLLARIFQIQGNVKASMGALEHAYKLRPDVPLLQKIYQEALNTSPKDYNKVSIPIFFNPLQVE